LGLGVRFFLYTKANPTTPTELIANDTSSVQNSTFIPNAPVKFLTHGYIDSITAEFVTSVKDAYLNQTTGGINVIAVDWDLLSLGPTYADAMLHTTVVGSEIAKLVQFLIQQGVTTTDSIHLTGHSLGAHISGIAGLALNSTVGLIGRITGLDAAGPGGYEVVGSGYRLDSSDAKFVDTIHSNGFGEGMYKPIGHVDFYPNGGITQPGCLAVDTNCNHIRSWMLFRESISNPQGFKSCKCPPYKFAIGGVPLYLSSSCSCKDATAYMGEYVSTSARGIFNLNTNSKSPFAQG